MAEMGKTWKELRGLAQDIRKAEAYICLCFTGSTHDSWLIPKDDDELKTEAYSDMLDQQCVCLVSKGVVDSFTISKYPGSKTAVGIYTCVCVSE